MGFLKMWRGLSGPRGLGIIKASWESLFGIIYEPGKIPDALGLRLSYSGRILPRPRVAVIASKGVGISAGGSGCTRTLHKLRGTYNINRQARASI